MGAGDTVQQRLPVTTGQDVINKKLFGELINQIVLGRKISWDPNRFQLTKAILRVTVDQEVTSGASLTTAFNERRLDPVIRWEAVQTNEMTEDYDVTSDILRGENVVTFIYEVSGFHVQAADARVSSDILLTFRQLTDVEDNRDPASGGSAKDKQALDRFISGVVDNAKLIVAVTLVGGAAIGVGYLYFKTSTLGRVTSFIRNR
jgi:hypothetical protein